MPPSSSPMITSTIAISTSVKPCCLLFIANLPWTVQARAYPQHPCHAKMGQKSGQNINLRGNGVEFPTTASVLRHFLSFRPASDTRLQLVESLLEESGLGGIADGPFCEQPADHDLRRLQLVQVLEDEDLHLLGPQRDVLRSRVVVDRRGVPARKRQVPQPVLGKDRGVGKPRPAPVGILEKLLVYEFQRDATTRLVGDFGINARREKQRILTARIERGQPVSRR